MAEDTRVTRRNVIAGIGSVTLPLMTAATSSSAQSESAATARGAGLAPSDTAVITLDIQNIFVAVTPGVQEGDYLPRVTGVLRELRKRGFPILHVAVSFRWVDVEASPHVPLFDVVRRDKVAVAGTPGVALHAALEARDSEPVFLKTSIDPFLTTNLEQVLHNLKVRNLVIFGIHTNYVVEATLRHAADMGYRVIVVEDCCAAMSADLHSFATTRIFPSFASRVIDSRELISSLS